MIKLLFFVLLIYILFAFENAKRNTENASSKYRHTLYVLHIILAILLTVWGTIHGISYLKTAPIAGIVTGILNLLLLYSQILTGIFCKRSPGKKHRQLHKIMSILLVVSVLCHAVILKIFFPC